MPHISSKKLQKEVSSRIHNRLIKTIVGNGAKNGQTVLNELLTPTEKIMLAKRFTAIMMLLQDESSYKVSKILKLSSKTTAYIMHDIDTGKYQQLEKLIKKKKNNDKFWADLEIIVRMGMPEMGKNRWKWFNEYSKKRKK